MPIEGWGDIGVGLGVGLEGAGHWGKVWLDGMVCGIGECGGGGLWAWWGWRVWTASLGGGGRIVPNDEL